MNKSLKITGGYYAAFIALGLAVSALGPTLPGLANQTSVSLKAISILFTARGFGFLVGALLAGRLYDRVTGHRLMALALVMMALSMALVPFVPALPLLVALMFMLGLFEPGVDVGGNTLIVWLHQHKVAPYMNGLHFFFGVGAFISPVIVAWAISVSGGIEWAFWALGLLILLPALFIARQPSPTAPPIIASDPRGQTNWSLVLLIAIFFFLYAGSEVAYGGWIFTYATTLGLTSEATAAILTSVFWGSLTAGRLLSIPIATRYRNRTVIFADLIGCLASVGVIVVWSQSVTAVWLGTIGLGLSMASVFPTTLSLAERHLHVSGKTTSYFFVGASLGGMSIPWFIGQRFEAVGPLATMTIIFTCLVASLAVFGILMRSISAREVMMAGEAGSV
ncbi:MAG: MFS transporter [Anaerolineae bacterium]|nr:MFS transporter [Anaerolineae bacterium]